MNKENIIVAFSEDHVERLTGVSKRQLQYWDRTGFFAPGLAAENRRLPFSRIYTFRDVVCLKVLNTLRNELKISLPHLREVKEALMHLGDDVWAKTTLYVLNRKVVINNPEIDQLEEPVSGQAILQIPLRVVQADMNKAVSALQERDAATVGKVRQTRGIASNKPVIAGTRIPVKAIKAFSESGFTTSQIREQYPSLTNEDIEAALAYGEAA
jgi:uncharacterized protein (DUF433 family)